MAELVAPQAVTLIVVDVGVSHLDLRDRLQARTDQPEEVSVISSVVQLDTVKRAVGVGDASPNGARYVYGVEAAGVGSQAIASPDPVPATGEPLRY